MRRSSSNRTGLFQAQRTKHINEHWVWSFMPKSSVKARKATIVAIFVEPRSGHREDSSSWVENPKDFTSLRRTKMRRSSSNRTGLFQAQRTKHINEHWVWSFMPKSSVKARKATIVAIFVEPRNGHREDPTILGDKCKHLSSLRRTNKCRSSSSRTGLFQIQRTKHINDHWIWSFMAKSSAKARRATIVAIFVDYQKVSRGDDFLI